MMYDVLWAWVYIFAVMLVLLSSSEVPAQCGTTYARKVVRVKEVEIVAVPIAVFQPFLVPTYGAGYYPTPLPPPPVQQAPAAPAAPAAAAAKEDPVLAELRKLNGRLDALEKRGAGQPIPPPGEPAAAPVGGIRLLTSHCAGCHEKSKAAALGKNFVMFDGPNLVLDDRGAVKALRRARRGEMPPQGNQLNVPPLTDAEFADVADVLELRK